MNPARLLRLVEIVERELGAADARIEIGGRDPADACIVSAAVPGMGRMVAVFETPPDNPQRMLDRLREIIAAFSNTLESAAHEPVDLAPPLQKVLEMELRKLADRCGASDALVLDTGSPVLWATSDQALLAARDAEALVSDGAVLGRVAEFGINPVDALAGEDQALQGLTETLADRPLARSILDMRARVKTPDAAGASRYVLACRAVALVRQRPEPVLDPALCVVQRFANIYELVLVFAAPHWEAATRRTLVRALPLIERLVLSLPPTDPDRPARRNVVRMRQPGRGRKP